MHTFFFFFFFFFHSATILYRLACLEVSKFSFAVRCRRAERKEEEEKKHTCASGMAVLIARLRGLKKKNNKRLGDINMEKGFFFFFLTSVDEQGCPITWNSRLASGIFASAASGSRTLSAPMFSSLIATKEVEEAGISAEARRPFPIIKTSAIKFTRTMSTKFHGPFPNDETPTI